MTLYLLNINRYSETYYVEASRLLELASRAYELFEGSEDSKKRELLHFLLQNSKMKGDKLIPTLQMPFDAILSQQNTRLAPRVGFEPTALILTGSRSTAELPGNVNYK